MQEPLEGYTVVEMTIAVQGPAAGLYLRDMGASVIKVEPPLGDANRYARGRYNETPPETPGPQFVAVNRGKRSLCLDLETALGRRALRDLIGQADVFLTNYREAALRKMGLDYPTLSERHPRLVYASVNGFGPQGPDAAKAMLDGAALARGGLLNHTGYADREPALPGAIIMDTAGAMQLALGTLTALLARERFGIGQRVQTSALGTALWLQQWELTHVSMTGARMLRDGNHHSIIRGPYGVYFSRDGDGFLLAHTMDQEAWDAFCIFGDALDLSLDERLVTPGQRLGEGLSDEDSAQIRQRMKEIFASRTTAEWVEFLYSQPEIIWERARCWQEVLTDEQSLANDYFTDVTLPGLGQTRTVGNLVRLSQSPGSEKGNPPALGEGNAELLGRLGFSADEIAEIDRRAASVRAVALAELLAAREPGDD